MNANTIMNFIMMIVGLIFMIVIGRFFYNTFTGKGNILNDALTGIISKIRGKDASLGTTIGDAVDNIFPNKNKILTNDDLLTKKAKSCILEKNTTAKRTFTPWCNHTDVKRRMTELES